MDDAESAAWLGLMSVCEVLPSALDAQLQRDAGITHYEFMVLSTVRLAPESTMRMSHVARATNATLPRLSHVCSRLEKRGLVERLPCAGDKRATNLHLTTAGRAVLIRSIPGHIATARELVIDALTPEQLDQLASITTVIDARLMVEQRARLGNAGLPSEPPPVVTVNIEG